MKEELLSKALEYLNSGEAFFKEQAPDFIKQLIAFYSWQVSFEMWFFGAALILVGVLFVVFVFIAVMDGNDGCGFGAVAVGGIFIGCLIGFGASIENAKKLELAPKVFLIHALKEQLK